MFCFVWTLGGDIDTLWLFFGGNAMLARDWLAFLDKAPLTWMKQHNIHRYHSAQGARWSARVFTAFYHSPCLLYFNDLFDGILKMMLILKMLKIEICHSTWVDDFMLAIARFWRTWESIKCPGQWPGTTGRWQGLSHWHGVTYLQHFYAFFAIFWRQQVYIKGTGEAPEDQHLSWEHSDEHRNSTTIQYAILWKVHSLDYMGALVHPRGKVPPPPHAQRHTTTV